MVGEICVVDGKYSYTGTMSKIREPVGFSPKEMVKAGCRALWAIKKLGAAYWDTLGGQS